MDQSLKQPHRNKTSAGRARTIVPAILIIILGAGVMLYPKLTDLRYTLAQRQFAAQAADALATAEPDDDSSGGDKSHRGIGLPDGVVALLQIPAIDLETYVVEGTGRSSLMKGPGHYPDTPLPGETGNAAIAGHRTMYGHPFHDLDRLQPGDEIRTGTSTSTAVYRVTRIHVVDPSQTQVVSQTAGEHLTLTTCHPKGSAAERLVVVAELTH